MPIAANSLLKDARRLHRDCRISSSLLSSGDEHNEYDFLVRSTTLGTDLEERSVLLTCSDLTWYSMHICSTPLTTARLQTYSGEETQLDEPEDRDLTYIFTTIYDRDGIEMGLVYDIAAATLLPNFGDERKDANCGEHFLSYGSR